mmetsp:Transcript_15445/g.29144  ORF Transcript_15445/g.29144 Transcript_15445/m.29144 type:complete len:432 (+) Transcript_15445:201-1496(+)
MANICLGRFILTTWYGLSILIILAPYSASKAERILPMTSVFFNPGEYWIEGGERGNNLKYDEFVQCVDDLAQATETYASVMNKDAYLQFLSLQTNGKLSGISFPNLLPELSMAYWNLVCVITGDSCTTESAVTLKEIELYALDDGGWLIYQLCSRVDVYIQDALLTIPPTMVPSSAPSTKETSFRFAFQFNPELIPCYQDSISDMIDDEIKDILKCDDSGVCAGSLQLDSIRTNSLEYSCQAFGTCVLVTIIVDFVSERAINVNALRRAITTGLENYINDENEFKTTCRPSSVPTYAPSKSLAPSRNPSMAPTITSKPSFTPTVSRKPSSIPSSNPTSSPSTKQASYQFVYNVEYTVPTECLQKELNALTLSEMEEALDFYNYSVNVDVLVAPIGKDYCYMDLCYEFPLLKNSISHHVVISSQLLMCHLSL